MPYSRHNCYVPSARTAFPASAAPRLGMPQRLILLGTNGKGEAGDFIVDDDGMGYADIGEEEDWAAEHGPAKKAKTKREKKSSEGPAGTSGLCSLPSNAWLWVPRASANQEHGAGKPGRKASPEPQDPAAKQRIAKMFSMAARRNTTVKNDAATAETADVLLNELLGEGGGSEKTIKAHTPPVRPHAPAAR